MLTTWVLDAVAEMLAGLGAQRSVEPLVEVLKVINPEASNQYPVAIVAKVGV
jgi:HEAT repeat protein